MHQLRITVPCIQARHHPDYVPYLPKDPAQGISNRVRRDIPRGPAQAAQDYGVLVLQAPPGGAGESVSVLYLLPQLYRRWAKVVHAGGVNR